MSGSASRSDPSLARLPTPRRQRTDASVRLEAARIGGATRATKVAEAGSARVRLPRTADAALDAVLINTGGGIAAGDRFRTAIEAGAAADVTVATVAAEKVYRSDGDPARVSVDLRIAAAARLDWLPQETILFDGARLERTLSADLAADGRLLIFEAVVFGRAASGESMRHGALHDAWRIRRAGQLVYADTFSIAGPIAAQLARPAVAGGCRALATALYVAPDAQARLESARDMLGGGAVTCAASAWNGCLAVRFLAPDIERLRAAAVRFLLAFRGRPLPRVWGC